MSYIDLLQNNGGTNKNIYPSNLIQNYCLTSAGVSVVSGNFLSLSGQTATERNASILINRTGLISGLVISLTTAPGGVTISTFTVRKNGVGTPLAVAITGTATTGSDTLHSVQVNAGDFISLQYTATGVTAASDAIASFSFL